MSAQDLFQSINDLAPEAQRKIIDRLEYRGNDPIFVRMRETYLDRMKIAPDARVLDLGCGTGVVTRALAGRIGPAGRIAGVDFSDVLIGAGRELAEAEGLTDRMELRVGDTHALDDDDDSFDVVIAHTLVSHVTDPAAAIAEAARVARPGGLIAIFDGDYASITFGAGDQAENAEIGDAILDGMVANPFIMRQMPDVLDSLGLTLVDFLPEVLAEAGTGEFFLNMAESYVPMIVNAGVAPAFAGDWLARQRAASAAGRFYGACNYSTFVARAGS